MLHVTFAYLGSFWHLHVSKIGDGPNCKLGKLASHAMGRQRETWGVNRPGLVVYATLAGQYASGARLVRCSPPWRSNPTVHPKDRRKCSTGGNWKKLMVEHKMVNGIKNPKINIIPDVCWYNFKTFFVYRVQSSLWISGGLFHEVKLWCERLQVPIIQFFKLFVFNGGLNGILNW